MNRILCLGFIALTVGLANGAVVREGDMMEMVQGMLSNPDQYAAALGMVRNKRSAWDKEFNLDKMGFSFKIKYNDASNRAKGGKCEVYFKDVRKFYKQVPAKSVKLTINFDNNKVGDMLFNLNVDYEIGFLFGGQDSGKLHVERKKDGSFYQFNLDFKSDKQNNPDRPPTMKLELKSDWATKAFGKLIYDSVEYGAKEYNWELDFNKAGTFKGVFKGEKTYSFEGQYNAATNQVDLVVDIDGKKYLGYANLELTDGSTGIVKFNFDLGPVGKFDFEAKADTDFSDVSVKFFMNDKDLFTVQVKEDSKNEPEELLWEARWTGVFVGDGKIRFAYKENKEIKFQFLPKTGMTFECVIEMTDTTLHLRSTANNNGKKEFEVNFKTSLAVNAKSVGYNTKFDWFIRERNPFYRVFYQMNCLHCLGNFNLESNLMFDKLSPNKVDFDIFSVSENGSKQKEVYLTTNDKYYAMFSKNFLNEMGHLFNSNMKSFEMFEITADWNPGKYLKITSNRKWLQSFMIENMDGYMRKIMFNGEEVMKGGFAKNGNQIKQTVELANGEKMDVLLTWETDSYYKNSAKLTLDGPDGNKLQTEFDWDLISHKKQLVIKMDTEDKVNGKAKNTFEFYYQKDGENETFSSKNKLELSNNPQLGNFRTENELKGFLTPNAKPVINLKDIYYYEDERYGWEYDSQSGFGLII